MTSDSKPTLRDYVTLYLEYREMGKKLNDMRQLFNACNPYGTQNYTIPDRFVIYLEGELHLVRTNGIGAIEQVVPIEVIGDNS